MNILFSTNNHLGDAVICSTVLYNAKKSYPDVNFGFQTNYQAVFANNPHISKFDRVDYRILLEYAPYSQRTGDGGNCVEAFNLNAKVQLERLLGRPYIFEKKVFDVYMTEHEKKNKYGDYILLNANCQTCSETKAYPWFQEIVNARRNLKFIQIGSKEDRDIQQVLTGTKNLRGKTTIRDLITLVSNAKVIITPPSAVVHIASAFPQVKVIVISGGREPEILTKYDNTVHITSEICKPYNGKYGCMKFFTRPIDIRTCTECIERKGQKFPKCMADCDWREIVKYL